MIHELESANNTFLHPACSTLNAQCSTNQVRTGAPTHMDGTCQHIQAGVISGRGAGRLVSLQRVCFRVTTVLKVAAQVVDQDDESTYSLPHAELTISMADYQTAEII